MKQDVFAQICAMEQSPDAWEATVQYLADHMKPFLQTLEPVLICFPDEGPSSIGGVFKEAVLRCEAKPVFWGPDYRWKELLRLAFDTHANTIVGHSQVVLGLMKLSRATATPLYAYDVIVAGDPFPRWMVDGLKKGFDCNIWGCYAVSGGSVIGGFSCTQEAGIHIREDVFIPQLVQPEYEMPGHHYGKLFFSYAKQLELIYDPQQYALLQHQPCCCGCEEPRVVEAKPMRRNAQLRERLEEELLTWSSVLDYRVEYTEFGTALELVVFPGESIPKVPSVAKLNIRNWNPQEDIPFCLRNFSGKIPENVTENR